jgi:DNA-binding MarR family transcriptional regulator
VTSQHGASGSGRGPDPDDIVASWHTIVDGAARTQQRALSRVEETGLPGVWFEALYTLLHAEGHRLPMNRLAQSLLMTAGGFTKLADRMARAGLIDRRSSEGDRRVVYAALTEDGVRLAQQGEQTYRDALRESVVDVLDPETVRVVTEAMERLRAIHRPPAPAETLVVARRDPQLPERRQSPR